MMGGRTPETCSAVNKRQDNKLENFCIWLVIYLNYVNYSKNVRKRDYTSTLLDSLLQEFEVNIDRNLR